MEQPVYYWDPSIAPSGAVFYTGALFPEWKGNLFVGALAGQALHRLVLDGDKVVGEEVLLPDLGERIRDVRQGADGALWLLTDKPRDAYCGWCHANEGRPGRPVAGRHGATHRPRRFGANGSQGAAGGEGPCRLAGVGRA